MRIIFLSLFSLLSLLSIAQLQGPGTCSSYTVSGNTVVFNCSGTKKVSLKLCNSGLVKVWYSASGTFERNNPSFAVVKEDIEEINDIHVEEQAQSFEIFTNKLRIRINKDPFQLLLFDKYQKLLLSDYKDRGLLKDTGRIVSYKTLRSDEQFFGLGEKSGPMNKRGRAYKMWNSDKPCYGPNEDPLYKSIPFFISSYRYGIFFDNTYKSEFKFGTDSDEYFSFEAPAGEMIYYFIYGQDYKQIIEQYIQLTGKPIMPPKWAFGFSQSRGMYTFEDQAIAIAKEFRSRKIPCDIIYQDIGWVQNLQDFEWNKERYKDPPGMLRQLGSMGFKMIVSQDPVISQKENKQWKEADSLGFFTTDIRTKKSYDMPWPWGGNCGVVDFTKPGVADWWGNYQQKPINDGVRGFWTDMGEPAWSNEDATERLFMKHYLGMHDEIHNVYGLTWDKVVKEQFEKHNPDKRIFQMTRAAYAGLQRYTFGWSGDAGNGNDVLDGWDQLANQLPMSLSAGMGGIPFWACDISGYCGDIKDHNAMAELYTRWMQFGVFNPLSRAHHEGNHAVEPWMFGAQAEDNSRKAIELKYQLFPYLYTYAREAYDKGLPVMRALLLEYPNDEEVFNTDGQFLFGKELLVAPVVKKGAAIKKVYLPEGDWTDFNNSKVAYEGKQWITYKAPLSTIPIFVKRGSIIPMMPVMNYIHEKESYPVYVMIYPANEGGSASFELYEDDGESLDYKKDIFAKTMFYCETKSKAYDLKIGGRKTNGYKVPAGRPIIIKLHADTKPASVIKDKLQVPFTSMTNFLKTSENEPSKLQWSWSEKEGICYIKVPDTGKETILSVVK